MILKNTFNSFGVALKNKPSSAGWEMLILFLKAQWSMLLFYYN